MNCVAVVLAALHCYGATLQTVPSIAVTESIPYEAVYIGERIYIKDPNNCKVMAHEFIHHLQFLHSGPARTPHEWWRREIEAMMLAEQVMECR